ncbi:TPA: hypothetical protein HA265_06045 [Candidatus Woesearchaeota archaeon]|nr:hypothetical protein [Candidatus Woesearchaeota archaeon]
MRYRYDMIALMMVLLLVAMMIVACAPGQPTREMPPAPKADLGKVVDGSSPAADDSAPADSEPVIDRSYDTRRGDYTPEEPATSAVEAEPEPAAPKASSSDVPVSQEELDALKADIEGIQTDDVGGLEE